MEGNEYHEVIGAVSDTQETKAEALEMALRGIPSLIKNKRWRIPLEQHRWGQHHEGPVDGCPECEYEQGEAEEDQPSKTH